ncbi:MAG: hypothetical protein IJU29_04395, partial [Oscillospiraceae bacterium]|nr:hypothetical protein [Oscillospiraceae bacterium]
KAQKPQEYFVYFKVFATLLREGTRRKAVGAHTAPWRKICRQTCAGIYSAFPQIRAESLSEYSR